MRKTSLFGAVTGAMLLASCGGGGSESQNALAGANSLMPADQALIEANVADLNAAGNAGEVTVDANAAATEEPRGAPARSSARKASPPPPPPPPARKSPPKAPAKAPPPAVDPHAGHDMDNMQHR
jgi:hypothetical protein